jgi:uncharacterized protein YlxW (UPF0749 family)
MSGDPKECRSQARQCSEMANRAATEKDRQTFLRLQRSWNRLAAEIEDAQAFLATLKATELGDAMDVERLATSSKRPRSAAE